MPYVDPTQDRIRSARRRREHPEKERVYQAKYYQSHRELKLEGAERRRYKHRYGETLEDRAVRFRLQGYRCGCCGIENLQYEGEWHTDADHSVSPPYVRAILCHRCNLSVQNCTSMDLIWARAIVSYLEKHQ